MWRSKNYKKIRLARSYCFPGIAKCMSRGEKKGKKKNNDREENRPAQAEHESNGSTYIESTDNVGYEASKAPPHEISDWVNIVTVWNVQTTQELFFCFKFIK